VGDSTTQSPGCWSKTHIAALPLQIPPFWRSHAQITISTVCTYQPRGRLLARLLYFPSWLRNRRWPACIDLR
jgi:hypothetical protein